MKTKLLFFVLSYSLLAYVTFLRNSNQCISMQQNAEQARNLASLKLSKAEIKAAEIPELYSEEWAAYLNSAQFSPYLQPKAQLETSIVLDETALAICSESELGIQETAAEWESYQMLEGFAQFLQASSSCSACYTSVTESLKEIGADILEGVQLKQYAERLEENAEESRWWPVDD